MAHQKPALYKIYIPIISEIIYDRLYRSKKLMKIHTQRDLDHEPLETLIVRYCGQLIELISLCRV